jgi:PIN domain nuclease of toxin-antitoxin system
VTVLRPEGRALLDTNAFLWWNKEPERLSARARAFIEEGANVIFLSAVSAWEIAVKYPKGHLELPQEAEDYVLKRVGREGFLPLAIEISHALHVSHLPTLHNDPFDRLLVSQAQLERLPILTSDANIARYDVEVIW